MFLTIRNPSKEFRLALSSMINSPASVGLVTSLVQILLRSHAKNLFVEGFLSIPSAVSLGPILVGGLPLFLQLWIFLAFAPTWFLSWMASIVSWISCIALSFSWLLVQEVIHSHFLSCVAASAWVSVLTLHVVDVFVFWNRFSTNHTIRPSKQLLDILILFVDWLVA
jgi:hypothetical protein